MKLTLRHLRQRIVQEIRRSGFFDSYFLEDVVPMLQARDLLPGKLGNVVGYGNEAVVFDFGNDRVIRFQPTYELSESDAEAVYTRFLRAPSGGRYARIYDVGKVEGFDEDEWKTKVFAVYAVLERLNKLTPDEAHVIDDVILNRALVDELDVPDKLKQFLREYLTLKVDHDSNNVMKRGDDYVIIDPE